MPSLDPASVVLTLAGLAIGGGFAVLAGKVTARIFLHFSRRQEDEA
jgi:hypothetical protein